MNGTIVLAIDFAFEMGSLPLALINPNAGHFKFQTFYLLAHTAIKDGIDMLGFKKLVKYATLRIGRSLSSRSRQLEQWFNGSKSFHH